MKTMQTLANSLVELNEEEILGIDGGIGVLGAIGLGVASYFAYELVNEGVKRATGKTIPENAAYYGGQALSAIGSGLQAVGDYLTR